MSDQAAGQPGQFRDLAELCLRMTDQLLRQHHYRIAGTPECRQAAHTIAGCLRASCDSVEEKTFSLHPKALWYVGKAVAVAYVLAAALALLGGYGFYLGTLLCLLALSYSLAQYVFCSRLFDRAFASADGCNVIGTLEPAGVARQQVVLMGHHDSPFVLSFLERFQRLAVVRFLLAILAYLWLCAYSLAASLQQLLTGSPRSLAGLPLWLTLAGLPLVLQLFTMVKSAPSPGAGDNLNATCMVASLAQYFSAERSQGTPLQHTRLIVLSTDGEEIGQRGAIQYVQSHEAPLHALPTSVFNIDSVYRYEHLAVLTRDRNFTCPLSATLASELCTVANGLGLSLKRGPLPFGGGSTDAAAFAAAGIEATSIIGLPTGPLNDGYWYHTSNDTVEHIEVAAVAAVLELAVEYIRHVDGRAGEHAGA